MFRESQLMKDSCTLLANRCYNHLAQYPSIYPSIYWIRNVSSRGTLSHVLLKPAYRLLSLPTFKFYSYISEHFIWKLDHFLNETLPFVYIVTCQAHPVLVKIRQIRCAIRSFRWRPRLAGTQQY